MKSAGSEDPDHELLRLLGQRDPGALRFLIARKLPRIHGLARRLLGEESEADDVAQEAFLRVWRIAPAWRHGEARLDTWLHRVVLNLCFDRLRKRRAILVTTLPDQEDPALSADQVIERDQTVVSVRAALAKLPLRQREAIILQTYQELSNVESAQALGISVEALESLLARARRALRSHLEGIGT